MLFFRKERILPVVVLEILCLLAIFAAIYDGFGKFCR